MPIKLEITEEQTHPLPEQIPSLFMRIMETTASLEQRMVSLHGVIGVAVIDEEAMQLLNKTYRGIDQPTDVLSFALWGEGDLFPSVEEQPLGDIAICMPKALHQATAYGHSVTRELCFLFVHGLLHVLGYEHDTTEEEKAMFGLQTRILMETGIVR